MRGGPAAPGTPLKTCSLEMSCKPLTQSSSPRTRGSSISTARRSHHHACSGCLAQPQPGPLHTPRQQKHCRGVAAENTAALPREDSGTGNSYAQHIQTPNCNQRLPATSQPTIPTLPTATPNPRSQRQLCHPRCLAALLSSLTPHGCSCTKQPKLHGIPRPALQTTHSGLFYTTVSSGQSPAGFPEQPHAHPGPTPPPKHKTAFLLFARKRYI